MKDRFEERLNNLKKIYKLTYEEKRLIMENILKRKKKFSFVFLIPVFILILILIYLLPHQTSFLTPNFILDENQGIKKIEIYLELYLSNPLFLTQMIYYLLLSLTIVFGFILIKLKLNIKGGR